MASDRNYSFYFFGEEKELKKILSNHWDSELGFSMDKFWTEEGEYMLYEKALVIIIHNAMKEITPNAFDSFLKITEDTNVSLCLLGGSNEENTLYFGFKNNENNMFSFLFGLKKGFKDFYKYINLKLFGFSDWENEVLVNHDKLGEPKESEKDEKSKKMDSPEWKDFVENHTSLIKEGEEWGESIIINDLEKDNWDG